MRVCSSEANNWEEAVKILPAHAGVFPIWILVMNNGKNLSRNGGCVSIGITMIAQYFVFTRKSEGVSEYWEEKGKDKSLYLCRGRKPLFSCFALALQEKTPESERQLRFLAR